MHQRIVLPGVPITTVGLNGGIDLFSRDYRIIESFTIVPGSPGRKRYLGNKEPRWCRICRKSETDTTFENTAHIIPQALGNRELCTYEECDSCNGLGSYLEDSLVKYIEPGRAMFPERTKKGRAKHKYSQSYIARSEKDGNTIEIVSYDGDDSLKIEEMGEDRLRVSVRKQPFNPMSAAKAIARMGFLVIPSNLLTEFDHLRRWIRGEVDYTPKFATVFFPGTGMTQCNLILTRRRQNLIGYPPLIIAFSFSHYLYFFYVPEATLQIPTETPLPRFPLSGYSPFRPEAKIHTVKRDGIITDAYDTFTVRCKSKKDTPH